MATYPSPTLDNVTVQGAADIATANIAAGAIDGTTVGATTPAAVNATTLTASGAISGAGVTSLLAPYTLSADLASTTAGKGSKLIAFIGGLAGAIARWVQDKLRERVSVQDFGVVGDGVYVASSSVSITTGTATLTVVGASFVSSDVGKAILVPGAGAAGAALPTTIAAWTDATHVTLATNAGTTLSAVAETIVYGTDNTGAMATAMAAGGALVMPAGVYLTGAFSPITGSNIKGDGVDSTILQPIGTIAGTTFITLSSADNVEISHFSVADISTTYPTLIPIHANACGGLYVHDVYLNPCTQGVNTNNCTNALFQRVTVANPLTLGIQHNGTSSKNIKTDTCTVFGAGTSHGIQCYQGSGHEVTDCTVYGSGIFNINFWQVSNGCISRNICYNSIKEGINLQDSSTILLTDNNLYWTGGASTDFGISVWGQSSTSSTCNFNIISGNNIGGCAKSGIALADASSYNKVLGNTIINPNSLNEAQGAAVLLYGSACKNNVVSENLAYAGNGKMQYGVNEYNDPTLGQPSNNRIDSNKIDGAVVAAVSKVATSTEALNTDGYKSYTPTITAGTGTLTTASATGQYYEIGKMVYFHIKGTITANGTGANDIVFTLPYTAGTVDGEAYGREAAISGIALAGVIGAGTNTVSVFTATNSYPGGTGASIKISGFYQRA